VSGRGLKAIVAAGAMIGVCAFAAPAQGAYQWADGTFKTSTITNCPSIIFNNPYQEQGAATYVGQYIDPNAIPDKGQTFYVHIVAVATGNSCSGQYVHFELLPPSGVTTAVTPSTPIQCWALNFNTNPPSAQQEPAWQSANNPNDGACPTAPEGGGFQGPSFDAYNEAGTSANPWPLPQGRGWEIQIPVVSNRQLVGIGAPSCGDCIKALVYLLDGNSSPQLFPEEGLFVSNTAGSGSTGGPGGSGGTGSGITPNVQRPAPAAPATPAGSGPTAPTKKKCKKKRHATAAKKCKKK
jgi:hypothetical protein